MSGAMLYTQGLGSRPQNVEIPHIDTRNPTVDDTNYPLGKRWINEWTNGIWTLTSFSYNNLEQIANWNSLSGLGIVAVGQAQILSDGMITIMCPQCTVDSIVFIIYSNFGGALGLVAVPPSSIQSGQFTILSSNSGDNSGFYYFVVN